MTTYLATALGDTASAEIMTVAFCSGYCRDVLYWDSGRPDMTQRDDDHYEFDETCANCGVVIPASEPALAEIFTSMGEIAKLAGLL